MGLQERLSGPSVHPWSEYRTRFCYRVNRLESPFRTALALPTSSDSIESLSAGPANRIPAMTSVNQSVPKYMIEPMRLSANDDAAGVHLGYPVAVRVGQYGDDCRKRGMERREHVGVGLTRPTSCGDWGQVVNSDAPTPSVGAGGSPGRRSKAEDEHLQQPHRVVSLPRPSPRGSG